MDLQEYLIFGRVSLLKIDAHIVVCPNNGGVKQGQISWTSLLNADNLLRNIVEFAKQEFVWQKENIVVSHHETHTTSIMFFRFLLQIPNKYLTRKLEAIPDIIKFNATSQ